MIQKIVKNAGFKWLLAAVGLGLAAAGPLAVTSAPGWWSSLTGRWTTAEKGPSSPAAAGQVAIPPEPPQLLPDPTRPIDASSGSAGTIRLADVFRFDVTIRELTSRWPRVSTSLPDLQLQGYRVPLVTGPAQTDLAGALTYYFNPQQQVQRITFQGTTGDGRELARLLTARYGFQRRMSAEPNLFVYEVPVRRGQAQSVLRLKLAPLLKADRPNQRFDVSLLIERPLDKPLVSRVLGERG